MTDLDRNRRIAAAALVTSALSIAASSVLVRRAYDFGSSPDAVMLIRVAVPALAFGLWVAAAAVHSRSLPRLGRDLLVFASLYGLILLVITGRSRSCAVELPPPTSSSPRTPRAANTRAHRRQAATTPAAQSHGRPPQPRSNVRLRAARTPGRSC